VPQGVQPLAQLLSVPSTSVPLGSAAVFISAWPAAGPWRVIGVLPWMRRLYGEPATWAQLPSLLRLTWTTLTPWAACALRAFSKVKGAIQSAGSVPASMA
jgi:hypothetical protein